MCIYIQNRRPYTSSRVYTYEGLVRNLTDGTYLGVWVFHPRWVRGRGVVSVGLVVVQVERLFTAAVVSGSGRALQHGEPQLHINLGGSPALDEATAKPVAGGAVALADLVGPHAVVLVIQTADFLPLRRTDERTKHVKLKRRLTPGAKTTE